MQTEVIDWKLITSLSLYFLYNDLDLTDPKYNTNFSIQTQVIDWKLMIYLSLFYQRIPDWYKYNPRLGFMLGCYIHVSL